MLPAFLMAGFGLDALDRIAGSRRLLLPGLLFAGLLWNLHLYFGLEARSALAARVMAYEIRLIADEVRDTDLPVYIVGADALSKRRVLEELPRSEAPPYLARNSTFAMGTGYSLRAVEYLSGRRQTLAAPGDPAVGIVIARADRFRTTPIATPAVLLFRPGGQDEAAVRARFPDVEVRYVEDVRGPLALGVAIVGRS
jgi:hypothetical protein